MSEKRQPWMKFYPTDWRGDPKLRMCSLSARGLWIELLGIMHEATPYGHLLVNGKAPEARQLGALVGTDAGEVQYLMNELEGFDVFSRTPDGIVFSRRMVADKKRADTGSKWAEQRWANGKPNGSPKKKPNAQKPEARVTEANASDALASDLGAALFGPCLTWLAKATDTHPDKLRSIIGRWRKEQGDTATLEAFVKARREAPSHPIEWITGYFRQRGKNGRVDDTPARRSALAGAFADCFGDDTQGAGADQSEGPGDQAGTDPGDLAAA